MTESEKFAVPRQAIAWAREAISEADVLASAFLESGAFSNVIEPYGHAGENALKVKLIKPLPSTIARKSTEVINNLRHSFDQSLFAACAAIGKPVKDAHFPWANNPVPDLNNRLVNPKTGKILVPPELWEVIRSQEPYPTGDGYTGGDDFIREVAKIANRKHTVGIPLGMQVGDVTFSATNMTQRFDEYVAMPEPNWDSVKNETILAITNARPPKFNQQYYIKFCISLDVPGVLQDTPFQSSLIAFADKAEAALKAFERRVAESGGGQPHHSERSWVREV